MRSYPSGASFLVSPQDSASRATLFLELMPNFPPENIQLFSSVRLGIPDPIPSHPTKMNNISRYHRDSAQSHCHRDMRAACGLLIFAFIIPDPSPSQSSILLFVVVYRRIFRHGSVCKSNELGIEPNAHAHAPVQRRHRRDRTCYRSSHHQAKDEAICRCGDL